MADTANPALLAGDIIVTVPYLIPRQRLSDLLCSAVEGGTGYWAQVDKMRRTPNLDYISVRFHEIESHKENAPARVCTVDLELLALGVERCAKSDHYRHHVTTFMEENDDAETADVMVQFAMFGEVIYG